MGSPHAYFDRLGYVYKLLVVIALSVTATILLKDIVVPLMFAALLAVVMQPLVKRIAKKTGLTLAVTLVLIGTVIVLGLLGWVLVEQIISLVDDLPNLQTRFDQFIADVTSTLRDKFNLQTSDLNQMVQDLVKTVSGYLGAFLLLTTNTISTLVQIPIYLFLLLIYQEKFKQFFISLLPEEEKELSWKKDVEKVVHGYIFGLLLVTLIVATLNTTGLLLLGIKHAIFFGILSGVLTIIPYVGIFIGALLPLIMALITKDSIWYAVGVVVVFSVVQFLEGNFITPRITGSKVSINALAAIIALIIGGKILGIAGMILAVPAIGLLKIVLSYSSHLKPFIILLGDDVDARRVADPTEHTPPVEELKEEIHDKEKKTGG